MKLLATDTAFLKDLLVIATPLLQTTQLPFMHEPAVPHQMRRRHRRMLSRTLEHKPLHTQLCHALLGCDRTVGSEAGLHGLTVRPAEYKLY